MQYIMPFRRLTLRDHLALTVASPPSTPITCPVIHEFSGSKSHERAEAMSSGVPIRPRACIPCEARSEASFWVMRLVRGVATRPGPTQFTRMLRGP